MTTKTRVKIGNEFRSMVADSNPLWRVTGINGPVITAIGVNEPYDIGGVEYPSEYAGEYREFLRTEVSNAIARDNAWATYAKQSQDETATFWAALQVADTLHYRVRNNAWVRGQVVVDEDGTKAFKSESLVGDGWLQHDLFTVDMTGSVHHGYHAKKVIDGEAWKPGYRDLWESKREGVDPSGLPEQDIYPQQPTAEQQPEYSKGAQVEAIRRAAEDYTLSLDDRLAQVRRILADEAVGERQ